MTKNRKDLTPGRITTRYVAKRRLSTASTAANIKVVIRVRPLNHKEQTENHNNVVKCKTHNTLIFDPDQDSTPFFFHGVKQVHRDLLKKQHKNMPFTFDRVFHESAGNEEVFDHSTKHLIDTLMEGCNCSVFVYGATGAGKTFTMLGKPDTPGITVLTIDELFTRKNSLSDERDFELFVTYLEVYNENVRDLLKPTKASLQLREDAQFGVRVAGLTHKRITNSAELFQLLEEGNKNRTQHPTDANAESSRSHAVFQVYLKMTVKTTGQTIMAKLSMIDLAGSERGAATGCKGMRFTEGANINRSLLALGNCINSLADGQRHVPYRDSKLTRILKDSLGGNCHTVMIANVSPSSRNFEDTYNTLRYATRAKKIKADVKKNVMASEKSAAEYIRVIEELNEEVRRLKEESAVLKEENTKLKMPRPLACSDTSNDVHAEMEVNDDVDSTTAEVINKTFTCVSTDIQPTHDAHKIQELFELLKEFEDKRHMLLKKKQLLEMRIDLKDEANNRLSGFTTDTPERTNGHRRLNQTMERLRRQTIQFHNEIHDIDTKISNAKQEILLHATPNLQSFIDTEETLLQLNRAMNEQEIMTAKLNMQNQELNMRGELLEEAAALLQPWYYLLKGRCLITDDMTLALNALRSRLLGYCSVKFEDNGDSGLSTSSSTSCSVSSAALLEPPTTETVSRTIVKRNYATMQLSPSTQSAGGPAAKERKVVQTADLFKETQPTPSKRANQRLQVRVSPHSKRASPMLKNRSSPRFRVQKENKEMVAAASTTALVGGRKPTGTMGTAARFPSSSTLYNQQGTKRPFKPFK